MENGAMEPNWTEGPILPRDLTDLLEDFESEDSDEEENEEQMCNYSSEETESE